MSTMTTAALQQSMEQQLLNVIMANYSIWNTHPDHYGFKTFDDFLKHLPNSYNSLIRHQHQHQNVNHIKESKTEQINSSLNPSSKYVADPKLEEENSNESAQSVVVKKHGKRSCIMKREINMVKNRVLNKLGKIDEDKPLMAPSSPSVTIGTNEKLNAFAHEFVPNTNGSDDGEQEKMYKKIQKFVPKHSARAKLNIYIPKNMTKQLMSKIYEQFPNTGTLYYYLDISTAFQINDEQMDIMEKDDEKIVFIHFDLHKKETRELLYGVIIPNDQHKIEANTYKWLWKLDRFLTAKEIKDEYNISEDDLPQSSRLMTNGLHSQCKLQQQLIDNQSLDINILNNVVWTDNSMKQIGSSQKGKKAKKAQEIKIVLNKTFWINECKKSWNDIPAIPIVVYENKDNNKHWIEWVKLIYIQSQNSYVGISFKYDNTWSVESICLDKGDIRNKHRLVAMNESEEVNYRQYFDKFNTTITEIQWK